MPLDSLHIEKKQTAVKKHNKMVIHGTFRIAQYASSEVTVTK